MEIISRHAIRYEMQISHSVGTPWPITHLLLAAISSPKPRCSIDMCPISDAGESYIAVSFPSSSQKTHPKLSLTVFEMELCFLATWLLAKNSHLYLIPVASSVYVLPSYRRCLALPYTPPLNQQ